MERSGLLKCLECCMIYTFQRNAANSPFFFVTTCNKDSVKRIPVPLGIPLSCHTPPPRNSKKSSAVRYGYFLELAIINFIDNINTHGSRSRRNQWLLKIQTNRKITDLFVHKFVRTQFDFIHYTVTANRKDASTDIGVTFRWNISKTFVSN